MKAWTVLGEKNIELKDMGADAPAPSCVKLKMLNAMLGTAECALYSGKSADLPIVAGRNGVGLVTELGEAAGSLKRGDRVYVRPVSACGECHACKSGNKNECEHNYTYGKSEDGVLRDFITVPHSDVIVLPPQVSADEGVFIERVALAISAVDTLKLEKGEYIVIVGANDVGLILAQAALYYQAVPIVIDVHEDRLELAEKLGVYYTVNAVSDDPVKKIFSLTCGKMAEALAYCVGTKLPVQRSFEFLSRGGRAAFVGFDDLKNNLSFDFMPLLGKNVSVKPVSSANDNYFSAVNMLASKAVDVTALIADRVAFDQVGIALAKMDVEPDEYTAVVVDIDKI